MIENSENWTYFQYVKELDFPIFVRLKLADFDPYILGILTQLKFSELDEKLEVEALETLKTNKYSRILTIKEATTAIAKQIDIISDSDQYGCESIIPKDRYNLYRYKGLGLMIYSFNSDEWELGCFPDFGEDKNLVGYTTIINRFLSWSLAPMGVIGFWGVPVDDGMVAMRRVDSKGEAVYLDLKHNRFFSIDGYKRISARFKILKLDPILKDRNKKMPESELLSYLSATCTYFDYFGHSVPIRQMLQSLSRQMDGIVHPKDSFKPRTDLSV